MEHDEVVRTILFEPGVALPTTYLNDVRFDLRRGAAGAAFITDSADRAPTGSSSSTSTPARVSGACTPSEHGGADAA
jgi:sugar lactone lactonase YvrE